MATTVDSAFSEFMKNSVNLDSQVVSSARASKKNLLDNIQEFANDSDFVRLCEGFNVHFGSFARKTKCRELDDIDLMIGIAADGACYYEYDPWDNVRIIASNTNQMQRECTRDDGTLNSTMVLNRFKKKLEKVREYSRSEVKRNGEAVNLNLISKDWAFDIVPCFHTVEETDGRAYYLIPNGKGNWKKTDPIANFGAHPKKSTNSAEIVEVEPHEAEVMLDLLEELFDYVFVKPAKNQKFIEEAKEKYGIEV